MSILSRGYARDIGTAIQVGYGIFAATGLTTDGTGDNTTALLAAITAVMAAGGGELRLPPGTIRCDGKLSIPYTGTLPPVQTAALVISGTGSWARSGAPTGGTILELRYSGDAIAKLDARGQGTLTLRDITFSDQGHSTTPFIQTTNTTIHVTRCAFIGWRGQSGTACDQDAIVLGGTAAPYTPDDTADSPFQGYGSTITECHFNHVRRAAYLRTYANGVVFARNTVWQQCGSNLADGGAIEILGPASYSNHGNIIAHNYLEALHYPYLVRLENAANNSIVDNCPDDNSSTYLAFVRCEATAARNRIVQDGTLTKPILSEATANTNTVITADQTAASNWTSIAKFNNQLQMTSADFVGPRTVNDGVAGAANDQFYMQAYTWGTTPKWQVTYDPASGAAENVVAFKRQSATETRVELGGSANGRVTAPLVLNLEHGAGSYVQLGPNSSPKVRIGTGTQIAGHLSGTKTWNPASIANGAFDSTTLTLTGAAVGDTVTVGLSDPVPAGAILAGAVTAANTVTVTLLNMTGGAIDLSGTLRADVWQH